MNRRNAVQLVAWVSLAFSAGCTTQPPQPIESAMAGRLAGLLPTPVLLLGEQHDAPEHQALQRETVQALAAQGALAALVLEMAEQGRQTTGLPADAPEARVREALGWSGDAPGGWSWATYGPVVMAAVRAGAPVLGGNLPRAQMRAAMADATLDERLDAAGLALQRQHIREGHCGLLPEGQIAPMTRIQIARDQHLAQTVGTAVRPGQTVLMVAGSQHVRRDLGVPRHLPPGLAHQVVVAQAQQGDATGTPPASADRVWLTPPREPRDYCADMRQQMKR